MPIRKIVISRRIVSFVHASRHRLLLRPICFQDMNANVDKHACLAASLPATSPPLSRHVRVPTALGQTPLAPAISPHRAAAAETDVFAAHHRRRRSAGSHGRLTVAPLAARPSTLASTCLWRRRSRTDHAHGFGHRVHLGLRVTAFEAARRLATTRTTGAVAGADFAAGQ
jgi:hypothetical protein